MKILVVHNRYRDRTGEDIVFHQEVDLLRSNDHQVQTLTVDNRQLEAPTVWTKLRLGLRTVWSATGYSLIKRKIQQFQPDIVHVHNTLPLLSPSIFYACHKASIPVVQTLHNYRLLCPANNLFRSQAICHACIDGSLLNSVKHKCYRQSRLQTLAVAAMLLWHRWQKTWTEKIDGYITLSQFQKSQTFATGINPQKIYIKPNFIQANNQSASPVKFGDYYLFVGRLIEEKGIRLLLEGYQRSNSTYPLVIIGSGYLDKEVIKAAETNSKIHYLGQQSNEKVLEKMTNAIALIFPSIWYECSPMVLMEAFSQRLPAIAVNLGATKEFVKPKQTGILFSPPIPQELAQTIQLIESDPKNWIGLKETIIEKIEPKYFQDQNYQILISIYRKIIDDYVFK